MTLREINEGHRKLNGELREENNLLLDIAFEMYDILSTIDFGHYDGELKMCFGDNLKYDTMSWEKWETVLDKSGAMTSMKALKDRQLRLF